MLDTCWFIFMSDYVPSLNPLPTMLFDRLTNSIHNKRFCLLHCDDIIKLQENKF